MSRQKWLIVHIFPQAKPTLWKLGKHYTFVYLIYLIVPIKFKYASTINNPN